MKARRDEITTIPQSALDWLFGEGPNANGEWFGDSEKDRGSGALWWRSQFRKLIGAVPQRVVSEGTSQVDDDMPEIIFAWRDGDRSEELPHGAWNEFKPGFSCAAYLFQQSSAVGKVDVEELKRTPNAAEHCTDEINGWNDCLDHLAQRGLLHPAPGLTGEKLGKVRQALNKNREALSWYINHLNGAIGSQRRAVRAIVITDEALAILSAITAGGEGS